MVRLQNSGPAGHLITLVADVDRYGNGLTYEWKWRLLGRDKWFDHMCCYPNVNCDNASHSPSCWGRWGRLQQTNCALSRRVKARPLAYLSRQLIEISVEPLLITDYLLWYVISKCIFLFVFFFSYIPRHKILLVLCWCYRRPGFFRETNRVGIWIWMMEMCSSSWCL